MNKIKTQPTESVKKLPESPKKETVKRQIIIETDGNDIKIIKAEVGGRIELVGILQTIIAFLNQQK